MGDEPLKGRIEATQPTRLVTRDWEGRLSPGQAAFSQPTEPRTTGHLHVTLVGNESQLLEEGEFVKQRDVSVLRDRRCSVGFGRRERLAMSH